MTSTEMLETRSLGTFPGLSDLGQQTLLVQPVTIIVSAENREKGILHENSIQF